MTPNFDEYIYKILYEDLKLPRCNGETFPQLSIKPEYRWMRCVANPYSTGYRRVFFGKRGKKINLNKCLRNPSQKGTQKREECDMALRTFKKLLRKRRKK